MSGVVHLVDHPLIQHKLGLMRNRHTSVKTFRQLIEELSALLAYEVTRDLPTRAVAIETPLETTTGLQIEGKKLVLVSILRAGNGFLEGFLRVMPNARVGHIGIFRDKQTLEAVEYYFKMPPSMPERDVIVLDPMLATGHTAVAAVNRLQQTVQPRSIRFACLVASPEGLRHFHDHHSEVPVFTAAVDRELNSHGYILPGLGDAGDRIYGTL